MVGDGGSSAGSYLADPTSPIPSHCAVITLFKSGPTASIVVTSTLRVKLPFQTQTRQSAQIGVYSLYDYLEACR